MSGRTPAHQRSYCLGPPCPLLSGHWGPSGCQVGEESSPEQSGTQALIETSQALCAEQLPGDEGGRWAFVGRS